MLQLISSVTSEPDAITHNHFFDTGSVSATLSMQKQAELAAHMITDLHKVIYKYEKFCIDMNCEDEFNKFEERIYVKYKIILDGDT